MTKARFLGTVALTLGLLVERPVYANGAFPYANQLVANPDDPDQLVMRGTFGLLVSRDRGAHWDWLCEAGMGYQDLMPPVAVLPSGVVLMALPTGLSRSDPSWCHFELAPDMQDQVIDVSAMRAEPGSAIAVTVDLPAQLSQVWQSTDDGQSWQPLGAPLEDFQAKTLDAAATDPNIIYVSGVGVGAGADDFLLRSSDRGSSWQQYVVPSTTTAGSAPFIGAVDPDMVDTLYVRRDGFPGSVLVTRDGGETFDELLRLEGPINSLALSPDGTTLLAGNLNDGTYRADTASLEVEQIACAGVSCLGWNEGGLYACGNINFNKFLVGASSDDGATFDTLLSPSCVRGPLACAENTSTRSVCPDEWPTVKASLGPPLCTAADLPPRDDSCLAQAGAAGSAGASASGSSGSDSGSGGSTGPNSDSHAGASGAAEAAGGAGSGDPSSSAGEPSTVDGGSATDPSPELVASGGCSVASPSGRLWGLGCIAAFVIRRRRRRRG